MYDKFHVLRHLGEALDTVRKSEYARVSEKGGRKFIKGQKYNLLSRWENLDLEGRQALKKLWKVNKRLNTVTPRTREDGHAPCLRETRSDLQQGVANCFDGHPFRIPMEDQETRRPDVFKRWRDFSWGMGSKSGLPDQAISSVSVPHPSRMDKAITLY